MWSQSEDGGAFAECFFAQYPLGMGRKPPTFVSTEALTRKRDQLVDDKTAVTTQGVSVLSSPILVPGAGTLVLGASNLDQNGSVVALNNDSENDTERIAQTTEKTREALEQVLRARETQEEDFSGRSLRRRDRKKPVMEIVLPGEIGVTGMHDPAPIVRSPVRAKKGTGDDGETGSSSFSSGMTTVPFSIGNWKNKRKLIIPLEQRLAQQDEILSCDGGGISDNVMQLAMAMQKARKEVEEEQAARERARREEEERRQAEREAEATRRAGELLEKAAASMMQTSTQRKKENREERLERIRLERELREREKQQEVRQRRLAKAATRLGITVEALEADEELLKTVDDAAATLGVNAVDHTLSHVNYSRDSTTITTSSSLLSGAKQQGSSIEQGLPSLYADDDEDSKRPAGGIRKGVFGSAVISNEGIRREMEALARMEVQQSEIKDGILLEKDDNDDDDDDDDGLGMKQFMKKKRRL